MNPQIKFKHDKNIINRLKKVDDWIIKGGPGVPFFTAIPARAITMGIENTQTGAGIEFIFIVSDPAKGFLNWGYDKKWLNAQSLAIISNEKLVFDFYHKWQLSLEKLNQFFDIFDSEKLISKDAIQQEYTNFKSLYQQEEIYGIFSQYFLWYSDEVIEELKKRYHKHYDVSALNNFFSVMTTPAELNFEKAMRLEILDVAIEISKNESTAISKLSPTQLQKQYPKIHRRLEEICDRYFWLRNNYANGKPLKIIHFWEELQVILKEKTATEIKFERRAIEDYGQILAEKQNTLKNQFKKINEVDLKRLNLIALGANWMDKRKKINLMANYYLDQFLVNISDVSGIDEKILRFSISDEVENYLQTGVFNYDVVSSRTKGYAEIITRDGKDYILTGSDYKFIKSLILKEVLDKADKISEFKGIVASPGEAIGVVRVVFDPHKVNNFNKGSILVAYMTRPDYVTLMHKAKAIITEEGGITSHAAIVARELGIPCIVGVPRITSRLKDGDLVEVDANKGVVKIIKKSK